MTNEEGGLRYLEMGVCRHFNPQTPLSCALTEDSCHSAETFMGHYQDAEIIQRCDPNDVVIGRCLQENTCALRASDCEIDQSDSNFRSSRWERDPCTIQRDKSIPQWDVDNPSYTRFGSCKNILTDEYFCIYDPKDCDESEVYEYATPAETLAAGTICDCSNVHVWGCRTDTGETFCAIDEFSFTLDGCVPTSPLSQKSDRERETGSDSDSDSNSNSHSDGLDCRLCRQSNTANPTPAPTLKGAKRQTVAPTNSPTVNAKSNNSSGSVETAALIGAAVGASVAAISMGFIFFIWWKRFYKARIAKEEKERKRREAPIKELSIQLDSPVAGPDGVLNFSFEVDSAVTDDFFDKEGGGDTADEEKNDNDEVSSTTF